jgi:hypothetical protein
LNTLFEETGQPAGLIGSEKGLPGRHGCTWATVKNGGGQIVFRLVAKVGREQGRAQTALETEAMAGATVLE